MKILHINTSDAKGGAAVAALRAHCGLRNAGFDSHFLMMCKDGDIPFSYSPFAITGHMRRLWSRRLTRVILYFKYKKNLNDFDPAWIGTHLKKTVQKMKADLIHLHWINYGFLKPEVLKYVKIPIIWTMHDMWPFTGGCQYSQGCSRYSNVCGRCPKLGSKSVKDTSHSLWLRKKESWRNINLTIVALNRWMESCVKKSSLFNTLPCFRIPNGIDDSLYYPSDKKAARQYFNLPESKKLVLFIAAYHHPNKGSDLIPLIHRQIQTPDTDLVVVGPALALPEAGQHCGYHGIGRLNRQEDLNKIYSAADVLIAPSREDNLPNVVIEAMACGLPAVAFNIGGMPDLICHRQTGILAPAFDINKFALGIDWLLKKDNRLDLISSKTRQRFEEKFSLSIQTKRLLDLYLRACK